MALNIDPEFFDQMDIKTKPRTWQEAIIDRINEGKVIPIISNAFTDNLAFFNHDNLIAQYGRYVGYPMESQGHDLARMTQYESVKETSEIRVKERYLEYLKEVLLKMAERAGDAVSPDRLAELRQQYKELTVSGMCKFLDHPELNAQNPLMLLAHFKLPVYLTTSYHSFLEMAIERVHQSKIKPEVEICRWHENLNIPSVFVQDKNYVPSPERPLVYHLHGLDTDAASLVLTEDDHLDFLTNVSNTIHTEVTKALRLSSLVVLGYHLPDWDFRVMFRGLIKAHRSLAMESVAVQLDRSNRQAMENVAIQLEETQEQKEYLKKYLDRQMKFKVVWTDDPGNFIRELYQGWRR